MKSLDIILINIKYYSFMYFGVLKWVADRIIVQKMLLTF